MLVETQEGLTEGRETQNAGFPHSNGLGSSRAGGVQRYGSRLKGILREVKPWEEGLIKSNETRTLNRFSADGGS